MFHALASLWEIIKLRDRPWDISHGLMLDDLLLLKNLAWRVKLIVQGHFHWQWVQQNFCEWDWEGYNTCGIHLVIQTSLGLILTSPMVSVKTSPFRFCTSDHFDTYMTQEIRVMSDLLGGIDFLMLSVNFLGPHFLGTFNYRCNLSHLYVFLTDRYIGLCSSCKIMHTGMSSCCCEPENKCIGMALQQLYLFSLGCQKRRNTFFKNPIDPNKIFKCNY